MGFLKKEKGGNLQRQINEIKKGGSLDLRYGEFHETLLIKKPVTIRSNHKTVSIAGQSPTVSIESKDVTLENILIESTDSDGICLSVKKGCNPNFNNVFLKGKVDGLEGEEGKWELPSVLELAIITNKKTNNRFVIFTPVQTNVSLSKIDVVTCNPTELKPGVNEVEITIEEIREGCLVSGDIILETQKYKLKRRISLYGNTLDLNKDTSSFDGKLLWECESADTNDINVDLLRHLPDGRQGEPYKFSLDKKQLRCEGSDISVDGLPDGLGFDSSLTSLKISGVSKVFGDFELRFKFRKNGSEYECSSQLIIEEKVIIPLKIVSLPDPIVYREGEKIKEKIEILRSNSSNITFQAQNYLPDGLHLNTLTGELHGRISRHGIHELKIKVDDGTTVVNQHINLHIHPKEPLKLNLEKEYTVNKNVGFTIPIIIDDAERLHPRVKLKNQPDQVFFYDNTCQIKGELAEAKGYVFEIEVEDTYKRITTGTVNIKCIDKPSYRIEWVSDKEVEIEGEKGDKHDERIRAKVVENGRATLKYSCVDSLPENFDLAEDGTLSVKINSNKSYPIKIRAEYEGYSSEEKFNVITTVRRKAFYRDSTKLGIRPETKPEYSLKKQLEPGRVDEYYSDIILSSGNMGHAGIDVANLPEGLSFIKQSHTIKGTPKKEGVYRVKVLGLNKDATTEIEIEIKRKLISDVFNKPIGENKNKEKKPDSTAKKVEPVLSEVFKSKNKNVDQKKWSDSTPAKEKKNIIGKAFGSSEKPE